jgi:hypothetical protein
VTTQAGREQCIQQALADSEGDPKRENYRVPFRGGLMLPVIEISLDLPVLNANSFRIAPALEDHPQVDLVMADPDSDAAQQVVAGLVRTAHRQADELKEHYPGVVTRTGKLINANTRCVLLRELYADGKIQTDRLRVAVLPPSFSPPDELQLESVLQQQREYKDEYNFVSELMMLRKLSEEAGLSDAQIAAQQERGKKGASEVRELREILALMERARRLLKPLVPISRFVTEKDQKENWKGVLRSVRAQDKIGNTAGADGILRSFLIATYLDLGAVHKGGRHIHESWVEDDLVARLTDSSDDLTQALVEHIQHIAAEPDPQFETPPGLDLLGDTASTAGPAAAVGTATLALVHKAATSPVGDITLASGKVVPAADVIARFKSTAGQAIADADRREEAGSRLERPVSYLTKALANLKDARKALADVVGEDEFDRHLEVVGPLVEEIATVIGQVGSLLVDDADDSE